LASLKNPQKPKPKKMTEEIEFILDSTKESMIGSIAHLEKEFLNIWCGKASPAMLEVFC
jgi:ribosome recycling factor